MSAMPQKPKLTIKTPITTAIMVLPSQFDEALRIPRSMGPTCLKEGTRSGSNADSARASTGLITHHKVAAACSQPRERDQKSGKRMKTHSLELTERLC